MSDEYDLTVECQGCGAEFSVPRISVGSSEKCPVCGTDVRITDELSGDSTRQEDIPELQAVDDDEVDEEEPVVATALGDSAFPEGRIFNSHLPEDPRAPCFVCLAEETKVRPAEIGPVIHSIIGGHRQDVFSFINHGMGIIARTDCDRACKIGEAMGFRGLKTFVVDASLIPDMGPRGRTQQVSVTAEGLVVGIDYVGTKRVVPWQDILAVAAVVSETRTEKYIPPRAVGAYGVGFAVGGVGGVGMPRRLPARTEHKKEQSVVLFILARDGRAAAGKPVLRVSFDEKKVNYGVLGHRRTASGTANFKLFCGAVIKRLPRSFVPGSARRFISSNARDLPRLTSQIQIDSFHRWLLCCVTGLLGPIE